MCLSLRNETPCFVRAKTKGLHLHGVRRNSSITLKTNVRVSPHGPNLAFVCVHKGQQEKDKFWRTKMRIVEKDIFFSAVMRIVTQDPRAGWFGEDQQIVIYCVLFNIYSNSNICFSFCYY